MFKNAITAAKSAIRKKAVAAGTALTLVGGQVMAAVPAEAETAITDGKADASSIAWMVFGVLVLIAIARHIRKTL